MWTEFVFIWGKVRREDVNAPTYACSGDEVNAIGSHSAPPQPGSTRSLLWRGVNTFASTRDAGKDLGRKASCPHFFFLFFLSLQKPQQSVYNPAPAPPSLLKVDGCVLRLCKFCGFCSLWTGGGKKIKQKMLTEKNDNRDHRKEMAGKIQQPSVFFFFFSWCYFAKIRVPRLTAARGEEWPTHQPRRPRKRRRWQEKNNMLIYFPRLPLESHEELPIINICTNYQFLKH